MSDRMNAPSAQDACVHCDEPIHLEHGADFVVWAHTLTGKTRCNNEPGPAITRAFPQGRRAGRG